MTIVDVIVLISVAVAMGVALGTIGAGGSILAIPVLMYSAHLDPHDATIVSLIVVAVSALAALVGHAPSIAWRVVGLMVPGIAMGTIAGTSINRQLDDGVLLLLLATAMVAASWRMWLRSRTAPAQPDVQANESAVGHRRHWAVLMLSGFSLGFLTGLLGIGGGFMAVPILVLVVGISMRSAIGTSLVLIAASALLAFFAQAISGIGQVEAAAWWSALVIAGFGAVGAVTGSRMSRRLAVPRLEAGFAVILIPLATVIAVDGVRSLVG